MNLAQSYNKQSQIVQNFFTKSAQVIAEARLSPDDLRTDDQASSSQTNINKWFNLELKELDFLHDSLRTWRQTNVDEPPPPLVIETYLNPSKLRPGQTIVLGDARCTTNQEIVLERWVIEYKPSKSAASKSPASTSADSSAVPTEDLPAVYKRAIISIRSLYTSVRLLPTWQLHQKLNKQKLISVPLKLGIRIHNGAFPISSRGRVGLSKSISEKRSTLQQFRIHPISMPIGTLHCGVTYRTDVNFGVEDIEKVMAQKFMELDAPQSSSGSSAAAGTTSAAVGSNPGTSAGTGSVGTGSFGTSTTFQPGSQASLGPRPILNFTRPFKSVEAGSGPRSIPGSQNSTGQIAPQSISGSASSVISTNSRFSSSFASQRLQHGLPPRSFSHESQARAASVNSQESHESFQNPGQLSNNTGLDPGSGLYTTQSDVGEFVKFVDDTRKKGAERIRQTSSDLDSTLSRYQNMRSSYGQLSDSIMQGSQQQETVKPERRRSGGPRSRLGFYPEQEDDEEQGGADSDLLFALSDMHV